MPSLVALALVIILSLTTIHASQQQQQPSTRPQQCSDARIAGEFEIFDPIHITDPSVHAQLCLEASVISVETIYGVINNLMIQVEDVMRAAGCTARMESNDICPGLLIHSQPVTARGLYEDSPQAPQISTIADQSPFAEFVANYAGALLDSARRCRPDWRIVQKMVRLGLKTMANKVYCVQHPVVAILPSSSSRGSRPGESGDGSGGCGPCSMNSVGPLPDGSIAPSSSQPACRDCALNNVGAPPPPPPYDRLVPSPAPQ